MGEAGKERGTSYGNGRFQDLCRSTRTIEAGIESRVQGPATATETSHVGGIG